MYNNGFIDMVQTFHYFDIVSHNPFTTLEPVNNRGTKACLIDGPQPQFPRPIALTKKCQWINARFKGSWFADSKSCFNRYSHAEEPFGKTEDSFS